MSDFMEILDAYPHCRAAVVYCEAILECRELGTPTVFDVIRGRIPTISFEDAFSIVKEAIFAEDDDGIAAVTLAAMKEIDHPEFRVYLRAKLGML